MENQEVKTLGVIVISSKDIPKLNQKGEIRFFEQRSIAVQLNNVFW